MKGGDKDALEEVAFSSPQATPQQVIDRLVVDGKAWVRVDKPKTTNLSIYTGNY